MTLKSRSSTLRIRSGRAAKRLLPVLAGLVLASPAIAQEEAPAAGSEATTPELFDEIWNAISGGSVNMNNRTRYEYVDQDGLDKANAFTNRLRLGYTTGDFRGYHGKIEFESNVTPFPNEYNAAGIHGDPTKAVVADPRGTEVNQAYLDFASDEWDLHWRVGRQRIIHDNARFVGNVGWRQLEQTYDAATVDSSFNTEKFDASYSYLWNVNRIFGPNGTNFRSNSHLLHASYDFNDYIKATGFAYLLDFDNSAADSTQTYGVRITGSYDINAESGVKLGYAGSFARQSDYGNNTASYDADYFSADVNVSKADLGTAGIGYELLGSDNGTTAFRTPLATGHAFNGWADVFLGTPADGLQDIYVYVGGDLFEGVKGKVVYHTFSADEGSDDYGQEFDAVLSKKINANWSVTAKLAVFSGEDTIADRTKFWLQTTFNF